MIDNTEIGLIDGVAAGFPPITFFTTIKNILGNLLQHVQEKSIGVVFNWLGNMLGKFLYWKTGCER